MKVTVPPATRLSFGSSHLVGPHQPRTCYQQEWRVVYFFPLTSSLVSIVPDINEAFSGCHIVNKHEYYPFIGAHEVQSHVV